MRQTRRGGGLAIALVMSALMLWAPPTAMRAQQDPDQLQQLVAPIALYPDDLVAEILAAATYPAQVDEAAHWLQQNASLTADQIASSADRMDWDSSVKGLTEFPVVLTMMDENLSWTSALGDAYFNQPDDVMDAVQVLRERAIAAGTLQSNSQITVSTQDSIIVIEPAATDTEYVPSYDCWSVFGAPISPWPEFVFAAGFVPGPRVRWDAGFHIAGQWGRVNWGLHNWKVDWSSHRVDYRRDAYVSHSPSVVDRHYAPRAPAPPRAGEPPRVEPRGNPSAPAGGRAPGRGPAEPAPVERRANPGAAPPAPPAPAERRTNPGAPVVGRSGGRAPAPANPEPVRRPEAPTNTQPIRPAPPVVAPKPVTPPQAPANAKSDRGFPQPKPPSPPAGTKSTAFTAINHGGVASNNADRGQSSMGVRPAQPRPPAAPHPPPAPPPGRGRGRGGQ